MEKARCNTELYSNLRGPLNNVKPSNFWGSHQQYRRIIPIHKFRMVCKGTVSKCEKSNNCVCVFVISKDLEYFTHNSGIFINNSLP